MLMTEKVFNQSLIDKIESEQVASSQSVNVFTNDNNDKVVSMPKADRAHMAANSKFRRDFIATLQGKGNGLIMAHLYHEFWNEPAKSGEASNYDSLQRRFGRLLYGGQAWDKFIEESKENGDYAIIDHDLAAIDFAVSESIVDHLPENLKLIEYGTGGKSGVQKPKRLIRALLENKAREISSYVGLDKLGRFAEESSVEIAEEFEELKAHSYFLVGDYTTKQRLVIPNGSDSTPVIVSFGGGFANAPDYSPNKGKNAKDNATDAFRQMHKQYGPNSYIILSYHCERDPKKLLNEYRRTKALESFILGTAFFRAVGAGIIKNKDYDPYSNWQLQPGYDDHEHRVVEYAVCQNNHVLSTVQGDFVFAEGHRLPFTLSHQWDEPDYQSILDKAGWDIIKSSRALNAPNGIILARARPALKLG